LEIRALSVRTREYLTTAEIERLMAAARKSSRFTRALKAWLGPKNIQHTVRYTELAPDRFKNFWR
jgi:Xaa-Pro aminopeptidase